MIEFLLYAVVFIFMLLGIIILPWAGVSAIKEAMWLYKNPKGPKWISNPFDIVACFAIGLVEIFCGLIFVFIGYQLMLEMIKTLTQ